MKASTRNLIIFTAATLGGGVVGIAVDRLAPAADRMQSLGALIWLAAPLAANLLLRAFGGDGWRDFGLGLNLRKGWPGYLAAVMIVPVVTMFSLGLSVATGAASAAGLRAAGWGPVLALMGSTFVAVMVKNVFEEFAWRGYLTPRLAGLKLNPFVAHGLTGLIWAGWHVPYYLYFLPQEALASHTPLGVGAFMGLAFVLLPLHAITYGEVRLLSGSVWPAWLMHNVANTLSLSLLSNGWVTISAGWGVVLSPGTEGIVATLLTALVGVGLMRYRLGQTATARRGGFSERAVVSPHPRPS